MIGRFGLILLLVSLAGVVFAPALVTILATDSPNSRRNSHSLCRHPELLSLIFFSYRSLPCRQGCSIPVIVCRPCGNADTAQYLFDPGYIISGAAGRRFPDRTFNRSPGCRRCATCFSDSISAQEKLTIRPRVIKRQGDEAGIEGVRRVLALTVPALLGVSVAQINILINTVLASFLVTGSVSWLYYSDRLMEFPLGVFGLALSTAILPHLSRKYTENSPGDFSRTLEWGTRWALLISIPSTVGLIILAQPMVSTIFYHGDFTENGVNMTVLSLIAFSLGLTPIVMVKVLSAGFFARQNTRTPVRIAMIAVAINIVFSLILVLPYKHVGLALATSISAFSNVLMLLVVLLRQRIFIVERGWIGFVVRIIIAATAMGLSIWWLIGAPGWWLEVSVWEKILRLGFLTGLGGITYMAALLLLGINPGLLWKIKEINE